MDFTDILAQIASGVVVTALTAAAVVKVAPGVAKWGYNKIIGWFR